MGISGKCAGYAVVATAMINMWTGAALAADACVQVNMLPHYDPGHMEGTPPECTFIGLPADLVSPDNSFVDTLQNNPDYPYAQVTTPSICIDDPKSATRWYEKPLTGSVNKVYERRAVFQRPKYSRSIKLPLIIWAHPNGGSEYLGPGTNPDGSVKPNDTRIRDGQRRPSGLASI